jgi:putative ABC transport system ATP-binding protein
MNSDALRWNFHHMIKLKNIERSYPIATGRTWVLRNINLDVREGEFLSITGPSGSGKSSLLNVLGMLDGDWQGEYTLDGVAVHAAALKQRQAMQRDAIGFIFQSYQLIGDLSVAENLELPLNYRDVPARERSARVADLLDRFQIVGKKDLLPAQLSGGQQQLVAVARALITRPRVVLADEPTGALHSDQARMIMQTLKQLNAEGATIIQVTHNPEYAAMGTRRVEMFDGWLKEVT